MRAFSGLKFPAEDLLAEEDEVAVRMAVRGKHTGISQAVAPIGKEIEFSVISIQRIVDGKVVEDWQANDQLILLLQIGKIPI